jgi:hypothetical protein
MWVSKPPCMGQVAAAGMDWVLTRYPQSLSCSLSPCLVHARCPPAPAPCSCCGHYWLQVDWTGTGADAGVKDQVGFRLLCTHLLPLHEALWSARLPVSTPLLARACVAAASPFLPLVPWRARGKQGATLADPSGHAARLHLLAAAGILALGSIGPSVSSNCWIAAGTMAHRAVVR